MVTWHGMPVISAANWSFPSPEPPDSSAATHALGPLATLGRDRTVTDVFVVADGRVFADRGSGAQLVSDLHIPPPETIAFARALIEAGGRHLDDASPVVDVRLGPGLRVHAALPPVSLGGASTRVGRGELRDGLNFWVHRQWEDHSLRGSFGQSLSPRPNCGVRRCCRARHRSPSCRPTRVSAGKS